MTSFGRKTQFSSKPSRPIQNFTPLSHQRYEELLGKVRELYEKADLKNDTENDSPHEPLTAQVVAAKEPLSGWDNNSSVRAAAREQAILEICQLMALYKITTQMLA